LYAADDVEHNQLHGSASTEDTTREIPFFFPVEQTVAVIKPSAIDQKGMCVCGWEGGGEQLDGDHLQWVLTIQGVVTHILPVEEAFVTRSQP